MKLVSALPDSWWFWAILATLTWAMWGVMVKAAGEKVPWQASYLLFAGATLLLCILCKPWALRFAADGSWLLAALGGLVGALGFIFFYKSLSLGPASLVVPMTGLYVPLAGILAVIVLQEGIDLNKGLGLTFATAAIIFFGRS